jgi:hypothetical protein
VKLPELVNPAGAGVSKSGERPTPSERAAALHGQSRSGQN